MRLVDHYTLFMLDILRVRRGGGLSHVNRAAANKRAACCEDRKFGDSRPNRHKCSLLSWAACARSGGETSPRMPLWLYKGSARAIRQ